MDDESGELVAGAESGGLSISAGRCRACCGTWASQASKKLISSMVGRMGFRAEMTQATGDGGIDSVAHLDKPIIGGRYLIQCKRFVGSVAAPIGREFYGAVQADRTAVKGILITAFEFTEQAREFAEHLPIEPIHRQKLNILLADMHSPEARCISRRCDLPDSSLCKQSIMI